MKNSKVAARRARNCKASLRSLAGDSTSAMMRKDIAGAALKKKVGSAAHRSSPNGSRENSSLVKSREAHSRTRPAAQEIDHATQRYADLYDFAPTGYVSFDRSGRIAEINLTATQLFGLTRQHLIGMPFSVFVFREDVPLFLNHLLRCRSSDSRVETELRLKNSKREIIYAQLCSTPITASPYKGVVLFQTSIVDLTERKRSEQALLQKDAELELIVTQTPFMFTRCTRDLRYRYVSRAYAGMLGRKPEEIAGKPLIEIMGTEGFETIRPYVERVLSGETVTYEGTVPFKDVGPRVLSTVYVPDKDRGEVIGWIASMLDITERRRGEQQVRVRDAVSHALAESGSLKEAAPRIIEAICDMADWEAGVLWDMNHASGELYCVDFWHRPWVNVPEFEAASRQRTFPRGIGLPGRVWLSSKPAWVPDVTRDDNFPRAPMAVKEGLHAGLCFPIKLGTQVLGAVECFSRQIREPDNELLETFASVGSQIGQFIERKRAEDRFRLAVESAPNAMVMVNQKGEIVLANSQTERVFGYTRQELLGKSVELLVPQRVRRQHPGDRTHFLAAPEARAMGAERDLHGLRKDGSEVPIEIGLNPIQIGGQTLILSSIVDITERKKAEAELARAAQQQSALYEFARRRQDAKAFKEIYDAALDAIVTALQCDRASILLYDQQEVMRFVAWRGLSQKYRQAIEGHSPWKPDVKNPQPVCISDIDLADLPKSLKRAIRAEDIRAAAFIPLVLEGKLIGKFMAYHRAPHVFTDSELSLAMTIARQLTQANEHRRAEEALRESEEHMRAIINQSNAGIASCDLKGRIFFANPKFCEMLGYKESELAEKTLFMLSHPEDVNVTKTRFRQMIEKKRSVEIEKRYIRKDGSVLWVSVSDTPVLDAGGKPVSAVAVAIDITQRKKAEAKLQKSKQILEKLVQQRTLALRHTNMELQSEMGRRKGLEEEILSVSDREQQRLGQELHDGLCQHLTAVAFMARSVALRLRNHRVIDADDIEKIAQLVNIAATDTRNLSRALHRVDVDAAGLISALQDLVDREIWKIPCRLEVKPSFRLDDNAAAAQLYCIARELVINANKHAQAREIVVKLEHSRREMVLRVIDDGIGFSDEQQPGQGLGFHIMRYRAQSIGGRLEIDSLKRGGTCVSCYLPDGAARPLKSHTHTHTHTHTERETEREGGHKPPPLEDREGTRNGKLKFFPSGPPSSPDF